eukprot:CAMPEP_0174733018 /NCGR_PEP_ID=MMETSP1094-20130205/60502_1 /TAXON_ID=156173 /ORGANISM="Chrysochromulina brevifilum, Strain UTEX LB 985" /LENGTH=43 /DNA_ID= /DNA_START= /DNA_END= /DNA_ORIENTATION=
MQFCQHRDIAAALAAAVVTTIPALISGASPMGRTRTMGCLVRA